jgi:PPOX class probable F420-dependent enzyme
MRRHRMIALTPDEQRQWLAEAHTIMLSTLDRRGWPHTVAMWYVADPDGTVAMTTFAKSQKAVNLRRDPRCALLLESGREYQELKGLLIRGRATLASDLDRVIEVLGRIHEKYNRGQPGEVRDALLGQARKRVVIAVRPERVSSWDHRKLGGTY